MSAAGPTRLRNKRGDGARLRSDIVDAARAILVSDGAGEPLTLRGVARHIGIAAPSIYPHFKTPDAILQAVIVQSWSDLNTAISTAIDGIQDPEQRVLVGSRAYVDFGVENPVLYALLFNRPPTAGDANHVVALDLLVDALEDCVRSGTSTAPSALEAAMDVWSALHGMVVLRTNRPHMPWAQRAVMEPRVVRALAGLRTDDAAT